MTMHLVRGMTSLNTRKGKQTPVDYSEYQLEFHAHNKQARRDGLPQLQFRTIEEYVAYRRGTGKRVDNRQSTKPLQTSKLISHRFIKETKAERTKAPVASSQPVKLEVKHYTGDYMIGIATMHKSNLVPVGRDTNPTDYSTMRRN
jgi:hypothetical protein